MMRYLFGPVTASFADQFLAGPRARGECLAVGADGCDLAVEPGDGWAKLTTRFPAGWKPDFVALYLPYTSVPGCLLAAPVPLVGLAPDWPLLWHIYRRRLKNFDAVLTDSAGVDVLRREGISHARAANLHGCEQALLDPAAEGTRDIDILFIGNANPAVQPGRLPWLMRLARLATRRRVMIRAGVFGDTYRRLLRRAKIVFSFVEFARPSRRYAEAAASGAVLFEHVQRAEEVAPLRDRESCVLCDDDNLEALLEHYLDDDAAHGRIAAAAKSASAGMTFEHYWQEALDGLERDWPALAARARHRVQPTPRDALFTRLWQATYATPRSDAELVSDLDAALAAEPNSAPLHNALGLALSLAHRHPRYEKPAAEVAADHFRRAVELSPGHLVARLNLAEALHSAGDAKTATEQCLQALAALERPTDLDPMSFDCGQYHAQFDDFRVLWERAAWENAGNSAAEVAAKKKLLRWRLSLLLAKLNGDIVYQFEAFAGRPDLPFSSGGLGVALASRGYSAASLAHLKKAVEGNPFDRDAARALGDMLHKVGDRDSLDRLIEERRLLSRAAPQLVPPEPWFSDRKPSGKELVSIIILCCNELEFTTHCLESVLKHTRAPYELVIVDNGSTDGTPGYLNELRSRSGPVRIDVVRNETNVGFPAGCNQALARARGRFLVLLNNDTIVTPGWLDTLIAVSISDWPAVGLVGPVSNYAPDAQGVRPGYAELDGLAAFAERRRRDFRGKVLWVNRLTGFCLLTRRDVLDRLGAFDERYGLGFFDDDDLCLRAREAGVKLAVAPEVYIHHFGSRTFKGLGIETRDQLSKNFEVFREKWGKDATAGYHLPEQAPDAPPSAAIKADEETSTLAAEPTAVIESAEPPRSPAEVHTIPAVARSLDLVLDRAAGTKQQSLVMMVKNEETRLGPCLESAAHLFDDTVIIDTGSTDRTKEIALRYGARVFDFPWCDSFAAARNEGLRHALGKWVMWLDADDRLNDEAQRKLPELFATLGDEVAAYAMRVRSVMDAGGTAFRLLDQVRLFRNVPGVVWEYRVHEQTLPSINRLGGAVRWTDIVIDHVGYQDVSVRRGKLERNLRLLELDAADKPDDSFTLFNLGWTQMDLGRTQEALKHLERSLEKSSRDASIVRKLYHLIAVARRQVGRKEAAREICRDGLKRFPDDTELLLEEALILLDEKEFPTAEANLRRLVESTPAPYFGSSDDGARGYRTRQLLAEQYLAHQRPSEAEVQLRAATIEKPPFIPAWLALGDLLLRQQRRPALQRLTDALGREPNGRLEAAVLRARGHFARKDFAAARAELEHTLPRFPEALGPRVLLSHVLLQEGRDPMAAERAIREVLALDPANGEAKHNLNILLKQAGRLAEA
jgi:GT2 family glycosyltransferase/tetratricopeptide (TPR) repeat protein